jgi:Divergent InlB B-repeat domain/FG-GAP repeat
MNSTDHALPPHLLTVADARSAACRAFRLCLGALVWAALLCLTPPAMADFTQANVPKLIASDPVGSAGRQGFSVAVSADGDIAIIGVPFDNSGAGAAWIFTRSGETWTQRQKLTADDASGCSKADLSACPQFGWSVALSADGNTAIVGGPGDNNSSGAAWVFTQSKGVWSNPGIKLIGTDAVGAAEQGYSVALSANGTTAIIGGWADNSALGAAWVFRRNGTQWNQRGAKIVGTGTTSPTDIFQGFSVALSGDGSVAIVGGPDDGIVIGPAPDYAVTEPPIGAAFVFVWSDGLWIQVTKLVGTNGNESGNESEQGFSVALSRDGSTAIVGGPGVETLGPGTSNATIQTCSKTDEPTSPICKGGTISSPQTETTVAMSNGAAWVFKVGNNGVSGPQGGIKLAGTPVPSSNPGQGFSVALNDRGNTMLLGAPSDNANTGAAWAFTLSSGTWTPEAKKLVGTGAVGAAGQGASVALSRNGSTAIIGGPLDQDATGAAWAFVQLFTLTVSDNGAGTISSSRSNVDCQTECSSSYLGGTRVALTATPQSGYVFAGWSGACSGTGSCVVTMSMAENVTATFAPAPNFTFVSGVGDDGNPCSREAPCRTFAAAISKTKAGGEIDVLDPGGYGPVTITKSITIDGKGMASILASGTDGITVNAGSTDVVILRNLNINGAGR